MFFSPKLSLSNPSSRAEPSQYVGLPCSTSRGAVEGYGLPNHQVMKAPFCTSNQLQNSLTDEVKNTNHCGNSTLLECLIPSVIRTISLDCGSGKSNVQNTFSGSPSLEMTT